MTKVKALMPTLVFKAKFIKPYTIIKKAVFWSFYLCKIIYWILIGEAI